MTDLVSICIPTYKQPQLLKKAVESVLMQSYTNFEIIISDDTPDDSVKQVLEQFKNSNLKYFKNEMPLGSPENWNNAIRQAKGAYIKVLHHDDHFTHKESLQKFVSALSSDQTVHFAFCYSDIFFRKTNEHYLHKQTNSQLKRLRSESEFLFFRNVIGAPSAVIFKNDKAIVFNKAFKWLVDVEFYINYLGKHKNFVCIKEALITVVDGGESQISQEVARSKEVVIKENLNLFSSIYSEKLNNKKSLLFFGELFLQFEIDTFERLKHEFVIPENIEMFLKNVFMDMQKNAFLKKVKKRLLTSRYNKRIFKIERF